MNELDVLVGKSIDRIQFDEQHLAFWSGGEAYRYRVEGDCCSHSYFYDFHGVRLLLEARAVLSVGTVLLDGEDEDEDGGSPDAVSRYDDYVRVYGYRIVSDHPTWGEVTAVMSFRNDSNGYYGGNLVPAGPNADLLEWRRVPFPPDEWDRVPTITDNVVETEPSE